MHPQVYPASNEILCQCQRQKRLRFASPKQQQEHETNTSKVVSSVLRRNNAARPLYVLRCCFITHRLFSEHQVTNMDLLFHVHGHLQLI